MKNITIIRKITCDSKYIFDAIKIKSRREKYVIFHENQNIYPFKNKFCIHLLNNVNILPSFIQNSSAQQRGQA